MGCVDCKTSGTKYERKKGDDVLNDLRKFNCDDTPNSTALLIGGCTQGKEQGCSKTIDVITLHGEDGGSKRLSIDQSPIRLLYGARAPAVHNFDGRVFVIGGCDDEGHHNRVQVLELKNETCCVLDPTNHCAVPPASCSAFIGHETTLTIAGGYDGRECLNQVHVLSLQSPSIDRTHHGKLIGRLKNATAARIDAARFRFYGGWDEHRTQSAVFEYSSETTETTYIHQLPYPVECHSSVQVDQGDIVYIFGGWTGCQLKKSILRIDQSTNEVIELGTTLSTPMECTAAIQIGPRHIVVAGGWDGHTAMDSVQLFEIREKEPYLVNVELDAAVTLSEARNRPAFVAIQ